MPRIAEPVACLFAALLILGACSPQSAEQVSGPTATTSATHPDSGLEIVPVTVTTDSGTHVFQAELAATPDAQRRGLMFRTELAPDEAMIFVYDEPQPLSFWMRNTVLPLDLIFIDAEGSIINIGEGIPYNEESVSSDRPGVAVLELIGGRAAELGIEAGDQVAW